MKWVACARKLGLLAGLLISLPGDAGAQFGGGGAVSPVVAPTRTCPGPIADEGTVVEIAEEPRAVDPASLLPAALTAPVTVQFKEAPLTEVVQWLRQERKLSVYLDAGAFFDAELQPSVPVTDHMRDEPVYLLLDRLKGLGFAWELQGDVVVVTSLAKAGESSFSQLYNLGEFCERGFDLQRLVAMFETITSGQWETIDGIGGSVTLLGDVAFVRQKFPVHREIQALLQGLRQPARRTMLLEPPQHAVWREKLRQPVSVSFQETPLRAAIAELSRLSGGEILIDLPALKDEGADDSAPVSLQVTDQPLSLVLDLLLEEHALDWQLVNGRLRVTTWTICSEQPMTAAVFDVRDLCRDDMESLALAQTILQQTTGMWMDVDGAGGAIIFPRPGILVAQQTPAVLDEILELLESYRAVRKQSPPRPADPLWLDVVLTRYYRLPTPMAEALVLQLPGLVAAGNWRTEQQPEAVGTITVIPSTPGMVNSLGHTVVSESDPKSPQPAIVVPYSVLVVQQTRKVHIDIAAVLQRVQHGDPLDLQAVPPGMATFGCFGGFGGGFPSIRE